MVFVEKKTTPLRKTRNTTSEASGEQKMEESSANMEMIATESENISTGIEGEEETVKFDDVQKSSRIDADQQVILLQALISI